MTLDTPTLVLHNVSTPAYVKRFARLAELAGDQLSKEFYFEMEVKPLTTLQ